MITHTEYRELWRAVFKYTNTHPYRRLNTAYNRHLQERYIGPLKELLGRFSDLPTLTPHTEIKNRGECINALRKIEGYITHSYTKAHLYYGRLLKYMNGTPSPLIHNLSRGMACSRLYTYQALLDCTNRLIDYLS